ncbi:MAG: hypothetical protein HRU09_18345 [Oligoflexales bacterium]|nr:hypothetical protein [Oligoflexales bacterium]
MLFFCLCKPDLVFAFGSTGLNGVGGQHGHEGSKGKHVSIKAQGQYAAFDLSGEDGIAGTDGLPGKSASNCEQKLQVKSDLIGASGGYGGHGGNGGDGGDGGNITVFFNELANLKKIQVVSQGGKGGAGGFGAYGGEGCACSVFSWQMTECEKHQTFKIGSCKIKQFFCTDGKGGQPGLLGSSGSKGAKGTAILIPQLTPLPESKDKLTIRLSDWEAQGAELTAHKYKVHYGANKLFASGSKLSSRYLLYEGLWEEKIYLRWYAPRPITEFEHIEVVIFVKENHSKSFEEIGIQFSPGFKHNGYFSKEFGRVYYTMTEASLQSR